jgi:hypothetical protein
MGAPNVVVRPGFAGGYQWHRKRHFCGLPRDLPDAKFHPRGGYLSQIA